MRKNKAEPNQILVLRSIHFASHDLNGVNEVRHKERKHMNKKEMAIAEKRIKKIYKDLQTEFPHIKLLGVTPEEKKIALQVHSLMWLAALEQKPGNFEEADHFVRSIIIGNSIMVDMGIIDEHAEVIR